MDGCGARPDRPDQGKGWGGDGHGRGALDAQTRMRGTGLDYEEVLHQRTMEIRLMNERGLDLPDRAGSVAAAEAATRPQQRFPAAACAW